MNIMLTILEILGIGLGIIALADYMTTVIIRTVKRVHELGSSRRR